MLMTTLSVLFHSHTPVEVVEHVVSNLALIKVHTDRFPIVLSVHLTQSINVSQMNAFSCTSVVQLRSDGGNYLFIGVACEHSERCSLAGQVTLSRQFTVC